MNAEPTPEPPAKRSKLFACYDTTADIQQIAPTSAEAQMTMYLNLCSQQRASEDCLEFWRKHESDLNKLYRLAMTVLSVPAKSAAVERVFSNGGLIMKPRMLCWEWDTDSWDLDLDYEDLTTTLDLIHGYEKRMFKYLTFYRLT